MFTDAHQRDGRGQVSGPRVRALALCAAIVLVSSAFVRAEEPLGPRFTYDLRTLRTTDPKLLRFDEAEPLDSGVSEPRAVAVGCDGTILVAGDRSIVALTADGAELWRTATADPVRCLAADGTGRVYAGMADHIETFDARGERRATWERLGPRAVLTSVTAGSNGVYVADAGNRFVWHFDGTGKVLGRLGERRAGDGEKGFIVPSPHFDVAFGPDGALWAVDPGRHQLRRYDGAGRVVSTWGKADAAIEGFCGCCNPTDIAIGPDGTFYTSEKGLARVKVYARDGTFTGVVAGSEQFAEDVTGLDLAIDSKGRVLVVDPKAGKVRVFVLKGGQP